MQLAVLLPGSLASKYATWACRSDSARQYILAAAKIGSTPRMRA